MSKTVGVIGGMGPEATVDFLRRVVTATPATGDADHIRILVDNNPKIPSRIAALIDGTGEDPLPVLIAMARGLENLGADFLVIPCNTAHFYLPTIAQAVSIPLLDMVALSVAQLATLSPNPRNIGMLASPAVQKVGLYAARLQAVGFDAVFPDADGEAKMLDIIRAVKASTVTPQHRRDYTDVATSLDADAYLIACTELSVIGPHDGTAKPYIDALDVLVSATIKEACP